MRPFVEDLAEIASTWVACYPNAGLPNALGEHDELPEDTSRFLGEFARDGLVNIVGGCCGTTPEHVRQIVAAVDGVAPRVVPERSAAARFSGLEPLELREDSNFTMIGERTNITGSARFRRLVEGGDFQAALDVALEQVRGGANLLDVNMDADLLDGERAMTTFLNLVATEPEVARIPIVIDSSRWSVLEAGLKCVQGKGVVNSLSLKEGEEAFPRAGAPGSALRRGRRRDGVRRGRASRDGRAQGRDLRARVPASRRAGGLPPEDLIFEPNVLAVATGIEEHRGFAKAFLERCR
jgi:5-methyltetrahydrofolate--homocysteine methyltransferase